MDAFKKLGLYMTRVRITHPFSRHLILLISIDICPQLARTVSQGQSKYNDIESKDRSVTDQSYYLPRALNMRHLDDLTSRFDHFCPVFQ